MGCHAAVLDLDSHAPIDGHRPPAASPADISGSEDSLAHSLPISTVLAPRAKRRDNESSHELVQALSRREPTAGAKSSVSRRLCCRGPVYRARVHNPIDVGRGKEIDQDSTSFDPFLAVRRVNRLHGTFRGISCIPSFGPVKNLACRRCPRFAIVANGDLRSFFYSLLEKDMGGRSGLKSLL